MIGRDIAMRASLAAGQVGTGVVVHTVFAPALTHAPGFPSPRLWVLAALLALAGAGGAGLASTVFALRAEAVAAQSSWRVCLVLEAAGLAALAVVIATVAGSGGVA